MQVRAAGRKRVHVGAHAAHEGRAAEAVSVRQEAGGADHLAGEGEREGVEDIAPPVAADAVAEHRIPYTIRWADHTHLAVILVLPSLHETCGGVSGARGATTLLSLLRKDVCRAGTGARCV